MSIVGIIVIEFLALGRLANYVIGVPIRTALAVIAVPFIAIDAISLIDPEKIYAHLLRPSLIALFIAQATVFLVYPLYRRRTDPQKWLAAARGGHGRGPDALRPLPRDLEPLAT